MSCWRLIVKKKNVAHTPDGRTQCPRWFNWLYEMKKDEEKSTEVHQKLVSRMIRGAEGGTGHVAQNHHANGVERRNTDSEGGGRRCQAVGQM